MAMLFGSRKSFRPSPAELPEALQELLGEVKEEKAELEVVLERVRNAAKSMNQVDEQLGHVSSRQAEISGAIEAAGERARSVTDLADQVKNARIQVIELTEGQKVAGTGLATLRDEMGSMAGEVDGLKSALKEARRLRADVDAMVGPSGTVDQLRTKSEELWDRRKGLREGLYGIEGTQQAIRQAQLDEQGALEERRAQAERMAQVVEEASSRLARMEATVAKLSKVQESASRAEQQLQNLNANALAEHVTHKTSALEKQREVMDRAAAQAARLDDLVWDLDRKLKKVTEDSKVIQKTQKHILGVQELVQRVEGQLTTLKTREETMARDGAGLERRLHELRDEVEAGLQRLEVERRGLDSMNSQVAGLRGALVEFEGQRADIENSTRNLAAATARADELSARLATLSAGVARVEEQAERAQAVRGVLERAEASTARLRERVQNLEDSRASLDVMSEEMGSLREAHDGVVDTLDRLKEARAELERSHATQGDVRLWLTQTKAQLKDLHAQVEGVDDAAGRIDDTRSLLENLISRTDVLENRERFVASLEERLDTLGALSNSLDERMRVLQEQRGEVTQMEEHASALNKRLDDADQRFRNVADRAEEAEQVEARITALAARVESTEGLVKEVEDTVLAATEKAGDVEALGAKMEEVGRDLEARESALARATADLERTTTLRQELAEAIRDLEGQERRVTHAISAAGEQASLMTDLADQVEGRVGSLRFAEKRMTQFEEKLVEFESAERNLDRTLQDLSERQGGVDAVRAELGELFATVERTVGDVRSIAAARQEIQRARTVLDDVLERAEKVDELAEAVDKKKTEIGDAEERMARLDTLLSDIQGSLETVRSQKAMIDAVFDKASQLAFQAKEAEALIGQLREERDVASRVLEAVQEVREEKRAG